MYYDLIKPLIFKLKPDTAQRFILRALRLAHTLGISKAFPSIPHLPCEVMGITFPNPIGLAAGLDKNGDYIDALSTLGFGFIELGTVTPQPQLGTPSPSIFCLSKHEAIISTTASNKGVDYLVGRLRATQYKGILGVNIAKNYNTPNNMAIDDFLYCYRRVAPYVNYVTINLASLGVTNDADLLTLLLKALKKEQTIYFELHKKYVSVVVKVTSDLTAAEIDRMANIFLVNNIDAIIATDATTNRFGLERITKESGNLSGKPLSECSTKIIQQFSALLNNDIPIIASGGIVSEEDARAKLSAGATLLQLYSGLIYRGPGFVFDLVANWPRVNLD